MSLVDEVISLSLNGIMIAPVLLYLIGHDNRWFIFHYLVL